MTFPSHHLIFISRSTSSMVLEPSSGASSLKKQENFHRKLENEADLVRLTTHLCELSARLGWQITGHIKSRVTNFEVFFNFFYRVSHRRLLWGLGEVPFIGSQFPTLALDWSSTNPHAPSPGHVNPGCRPRDPRRLSMEYQSTWFQAWRLWVWPTFEPLTPSPWFLIRWRLSLSPLLCVSFWSEHFNWVLAKCQRTLNSPRKLSFMLLNVMLIPETSSPVAEPTRGANPATF